MEVKIDTKSLDSRNYRILFELAKQEGIEALQKLLVDLGELNGKTLGHQAIFYGKHPTLSLTSTNKVAIAYLRDHKNELKGLDLSDSNIWYTIASLARTPDLLDTYLKNARILEEYRIGNIITFNDDSTLYYDLDIPVQIYRDKTGKITNIIKYYTDGEFKYGLIPSPKGIYNFQEINTELSSKIPATWVLMSENHEDGRQYRYMYLSSFDFNADKLPIEEELQSYDLPASLKLYMNK